MAVGLLVSVVTSCGPSESTGRTLDSRPGVLLVTLDTTRADALGCYGGRARTPVLDSLAATGARFTTAVTSVPVTLPAHATLLTGTYPPGHGARHNGQFALPASMETLAEHLADAGYDCAAVVGSAVLDSVFGVDQGFDTFVDFFDDLDPSQWGNQPPERPASEVTDLAIDALSDLGPSPFLWAHYYDPHDPYEPPAPFAAEYAESLYHGEIAYTDRELGRLIEAFRAKCGEKPGLVVVVADHGEGLGDHGEATHGMTLYEEAVRVPWIFHWSGTVPEGHVVERPVALVDALPTMLDLLGLEAPSGVHGESLRALVLGGGTDAAGPDPARPIYLETQYPRFGLGWAETRAIRTGSAKWIDAPLPELYDLAADPGERENRLIGTRSRTPEERDLVEAMDDLSKRIESSHPFVRLPPQLASVASRRLETLGYVSRATPGSSVGATGGVPRPKRRDVAAPPLDRAAELRARSSFRVPAPKDPKDVLVLDEEVLRIEDAAAAGRFASVRKELDALEAAARASLFVLHLEAECEIALEHPDRAREILRRILGRNGRDPVAALKLARIELQAGNPGEALDLTELADRWLRSDDAEGITLAAELDLERGDPKRALSRTDELLARTKKRRPSPATLGQIRYVRGRALRSEGRLDEAKEELLSAVSVSGLHREARLELADLQRRRGRTQEALQLVQPYLSATGGADLEALVLAAQIHLARDEPKLADARLELALAADPEDFQALHWQVRLYLHRRRFAKADAALKRVEQLYRDEPDLLLARAELHVEAERSPHRDLERALECARLASEIEGGSRAGLWIARALAGLDRREEAIEAARTALAEEPEDPDALRTLLAELESGR